MSEFTRNAQTGVYTLKADERVTIATYCECTRSRCSYKWGVYVDRGYGAENLSAHWTLAEAKEEAKALAHQRREAAEARARLATRAAKARVYLAANN